MVFNMEKFVSSILVMILALSLLLTACKNNSVESDYSNYTESDSSTSAKETDSSTDKSGDTASENNSISSTSPKNNVIAQSDEIILKNSDGYACGVTFTVKKNPIVKIDTTQGTPGNVLLDVTSPEIEVTLRNVTSGKILPKTPKIFVAAIYQSDFDSDNTAFDRHTVDFDDGRKFKSTWFATRLFYNPLDSLEVNQSKSLQGNNPSSPWSYEGLTFGYVKESVAAEYKKSIENPIGYILISDKYNKDMVYTDHFVTENVLGVYDGSGGKSIFSSILF